MKIHAAALRLEHLLALVAMCLCLLPISLSAQEASEPIETYRAYEQHAFRHQGDPAKGKELFEEPKRTQCAVCHKIGTVGGDVGPDLSSIGGKFDRPHLIESLLEPSRQIVEGYRTTTLVTNDGLSHSGIVKERSDTQIELLDANAKKHTIVRSEIDEESISSVSLMPESLAKNLTTQEFTDLIAYLESLRSGIKGNHGGNLVGPINVPEGFEIRSVVTGLDAVTALEVLPDGRVLVCEQAGKVRVIEHGKLLEEPFVTLPVDFYWERGVIGVTHDPEFPKQPYIYVCWVAKNPYPHHHISRFTADGNVAIPGSEKLLLVGDDQNKMGGHVPAGHQGGALHFGVDGKIYIGIGEQTAGEPSQKLDTFLGKILRVNPDGTIPSDNPFVDEAKGKYRAIWARGCRNPFTFAIRKTDGKMLINDVGGDFEEVNLGRAGANYGWPVVEHGDQKGYQKKEFQGPLHWYPHTSINGGDFCDEESEWSDRGRYFFADYILGWIKTLDPENPKDVKTFATGIRRLVDLRFAPDESLYLLVRNAWVYDSKLKTGTGSLLQIRPIRQAARESNNKIVLTKDCVDESAESLPAMRIKTPAATYYLEKTGGGLSSIVDRDGNDWLGFHPEKESRAGGEYRGFPNAVHKQSGNYFHPKNESTDAVTTRVEHVADDLVSISVTSETGHWAGRYDFFPTHCTFTITAMPADKKYWVLYEGTPGGKLDSADRWMTSAIETPQPMSFRHEGDIPSPEWMAFSDADGDRSIVLLNHEDDTYPDTFYQMDNKMTVFGFGRKGLTAYHAKVGQRFSIGLVESTRHSKIVKFADEIAEHSESTLDRVSITTKLGPQPGDIYREYALHNGGASDWRVTDPNATAERAKVYLPNPILSLAIDDMEHAVRAEVVLDRWGGHAGTKDKQIRFNGNDWITLPELTTTPEGSEPEQFYSQDNPIVAVSLKDLKQGVNTLEGGIGPRNAGHWWGQWGMYSAILRIYYAPEKKKYATGKIISPAADATLYENPKIKLACDKNAKRIDVLAWYDGYDEDGNGVFAEWHAARFQPLRGEPAALRDHVGTITPSDGLDLTWQTRWVPDQKPAAIKLVARIHGKDGLIYVTDTVERLSLQRDGWSVKQYHATGIQPHFGVRIGKTKSCQIPISSADDLSNATEAVMHYRTWEASDEHHSPFQINGHQHANEGLNHHYDYDLLPIPVSELRLGDNTFTIHSDTKHHMLEVLWPGPAITVRYRTGGISGH